MGTGFELFLINYFFLKKKGWDTCQLLDRRIDPTTQKEGNAWCKAWPFP